MRPAPHDGGGEAEGAILANAGAGDGVQPLHEAVLRGEAFSL
jgi:hypothetical protein